MKNTSANKAAQPPVPPSDEERYRRDVRLNFLLQDVARMQKRAFDKFMSPLGITRAQWLVLVTLSRQDGMTQTQLASMLDIGKANLGALIEQLRQLELIETAPHPVDGRATSVFLSKKGHKLEDRMIKAVRTYTELVLGDLDDGQRDQLATLLLGIKRSLSAPDIQPKSLPKRKAAKSMTFE